MITGQICNQEIAKLSNNVLNEFCNFNKLHTWNKTAGGSNANITNDVLGRRSYFGLGCVKIDFIGTSQVSFNAGGDQMNRVIQRTGNYVLSYAFNKTDISSDIVFTVEVYVNDTLYSETTITQDLYNTSGFVDNQWNVYFQNLTLEYGDTIDFAFKAQSDTTYCQLYFDRLKLELDDKGNGIPTIYTEAPLDVIEEENTIDVGNIPAGDTVTVTASLTGARVSESDKRNVVMTYPNQIIDEGLVVGVPLVTADDVVKFTIFNPTGSGVDLDEGVFNFKIVR